jgi:hypothetical protein
MPRSSANVPPSRSEMAAGSISMDSPPLRMIASPILRDRGTGFNSVGDNVPLAGGWTTSLPSRMLRGGRSTPAQHGTRIRFTDPGGDPA